MADRAVFWEISIDLCISLYTISQQYKDEIDISVSWTYRIYLTHEHESYYNIPHSIDVTFTLSSANEFIITQSRTSTRRQRWQASNLKSECYCVWQYVLVIYK